MIKGTETGETVVREGLSERVTCEQKCKENKEAGHAGNWGRRTSGSRKVICSGPQTLRHRDSPGNHMWFIMVEHRV